MKKLFELQINGEFSQYLKPSEIRLIQWDKECVYTLTSVLVSVERYNFLMGIK